MEQYELVEEISDWDTLVNTPWTKSQKQTLTTELDVIHCKIGKNTYEEYAIRKHLFHLVSAKRDSKQKTIARQILKEVYSLTIT